MLFQYRRRRQERWTKHWTGERGTKNISSPWSPPWSQMDMKWWHPGWQESEGKELGEEILLISTLVGKLILRFRTNKQFWKVQNSTSLTDPMQWLIVLSYGLLSNPSNKYPLNLESAVLLKSWFLEGKIDFYVRYGYFLNHGTTFLCSHFFRSMPGLEWFWTTWSLHSYFTMYLCSHFCDSARMASDPLEPNGQGMWPKKLCRWLLCTLSSSSSSSSSPWTNGRRRWPRNYAA